MKWTEKTLEALTERRQQGDFWVEGCAFVAKDDRCTDENKQDSSVAENNVTAQDRE